MACSSGLPHTEKCLFRNLSAAESSKTGLLVKTLNIETEETYFCKLSLHFVNYEKIYEILLSTSHIKTEISNINNAIVAFS